MAVVADDYSAVLGIAQIGDLMLGSARPIRPTPGTLAGVATITTGVTASISLAAVIGAHTAVLGNALLGDLVLGGAPPAQPATLAGKVTVTTTATRTRTGRVVVTEQFPV